MKAKNSYAFYQTWNGIKFLVCIFLVPYFYHDIESFFFPSYLDKVENAAMHNLFLLILFPVWLYFLVSSFVKVLHYQVSASGGTKDQVYNLDWRPVSVLKSIVRFFVYDLWSDSSRGVDRLRDYRQSLTIGMSDKNAAREYIETSALDNAMSNPRVRAYINSRIAGMSNQEAYEFIKKGI